MSRVRIVFMGTPEFAAVSLRRLLEDEHYEIVGVVTQPDRPAGRKLQLTPSAVKLVAQEHGLPVLTPESLKKDSACVETIRSWRAEVGVVVAFGQILTQEFLDMFNFGCVNVHGSLLPLWRGAAPIQRSIEAGDIETGVALQKMVKKLDAGDVLGIRKIKTGDMNSLELHDQLAILGADLLHIELMDYIRGNLSGVPQDESQVSFAKKIEKSESILSWSEPAEKLHNKVRAFVWGPGTHFQWGGKKYKVHRTRVIAGDSKSAPGIVSKVSPSELVVQTGKGCLELLELQPESRNRMSAQDFLKSHPVKVGEVLQ